MFLPYQDYAAVFMSTGLSRVSVGLHSALLLSDTHLLSHERQVLWTAIKIANALPPYMNVVALHGVDNLVMFIQCGQVTTDFY